MSEDDRLAKIKDLLESTVQQFESVFRSAGDFDQSRTGNGWTPSNIPTQMYLIKAIDIEKARRIAESRKTRLFGPLGFLRHRIRGIEMVGQPELIYFPYWQARAYHECFYFRGRTYTATVRNDVIAVQVGARIRPLISRLSVRGSLIRKLVTSIRRAVSARPATRYISIENATELAYQFNETSLLVDGNGKADPSMEYLLEKRPSMEYMSRAEASTNEGVVAKFAPVALDVEHVTKLLHAEIVRPPTVFSKILTNRFEVSELRLIELPVYVFRYRHLMSEKELRIHGVTGEIRK